MRVRWEVTQPHTPFGFWQETHWGEALRVPQMWEVLLPEGEPAGARSPELYEPLRAGMWLAQVPTWPPSCPREGPADLDGTVSARAAWSWGAVKSAACCSRWGHRSPEWKGNPEGIGVCLPGLWASEKGYLVGGLAAGKGHLATLFTPTSCPCLPRGLLPGQGPQGRPLALAPSLLG